VDSRRVWCRVGVHVGYDMICDVQTASHGRATFETASNPLPGFILVRAEEGSMDLP
jgi:hypothetical protein